MLYPKKLHNRYTGQTQVITTKKTS